MPKLKCSLALPADESNRVNDSFPAGCYYCRRSQSWTMIGESFSRCAASGESRRRNVGWRAGRGCQEFSDESWSSGREQSESWCWWWLFQWQTPSVSLRRCWNDFRAQFAWLIACIIDGLPIARHWHVLLVGSLADALIRLEVLL